MVRINKYLAECNLGSRRQVEEFIKDGLVRVNGKICVELSTKIDPENDEVSYKGKLVKPKEEKIYIMLNKPKNYLVSHKDQFDRKTVYDLIPNFGVHLFAIGRLDYMSTGLLLLTNDGEFANKIIHPRYKLAKVYKVKAKGHLTEQDIQKLENMRDLDGEKISGAKVKIKSKEEKILLSELLSSKEEKDKFAEWSKKIGSEVLELKRLQVGDVTLDNLPIGMWRHLKPNEVLSLWQSKKKR